MEDYNGYKCFYLFNITWKLVDEVNLYLKHFSFDLNIFSIEFMALVHIGGVTVIILGSGLSYQRSNPNWTYLPFT